MHFYIVIFIAYSSLKKFLKHTLQRAVTNNYLLLLTSRQLWTVCLFFCLPSFKEGSNLRKASNLFSQFSLLGFYFFFHLYVTVFFLLFLSLTAVLMVHLLFALAFENYIGFSLTVWILKSELYISWCTVGCTMWMMSELITIWSCCGVFFINSSSAIFHAFFLLYLRCCSLQIYALLITSSNQKWLQQDNLVLNISVFVPLYLQFPKRKKEILCSRFWPYTTTVGVCI